MIKSYRELTVWKKSIDLVIEVYELTKSFPKEELFGLTSQMRRASISIPSNIAEGHSRKYRQEFKQFIRTALGSGAELETQILISNRLGLINSSKSEKVNELTSEVMKMLSSLNRILTPRP
jgi:four helix bundle protein